MTRLKDIILRNSFENIWIKISEIYLESKKECYLQAWLFLEKIEAEKNDDFIIKVEHVTEAFSDETDKEEFDIVYGISMKDDLHYSLMLTYWREWLGMEISSESLKKYDEDELLAHIIWEITFSGYHPDDRQKEIDLMEQIKEEIEEGNYNTISFRDLF